MHDNMAPQKHVPPASSAVEIVLLDGGGFRTTDDWKLHAGGHSRPYFLYDWCFFIHHKPSGKKMLWDLGISNVCLVPAPRYHTESGSPIIRHQSNCLVTGPHSLYTQCAEHPME